MTSKLWHQVRFKVLPCPLQNPKVLDFEDVSECGKVLDSEFLESRYFRYKARRLKEDSLNSVKQSRIRVLDSVRIQ